MRVTFDHQIFVGQEHGGISRYFIEMGKAFQAVVPELDFSIVAPFYRNRILRETRGLPVKGMYLPRLPYLGRATREVSASLFRAYARAGGGGILHQTYFWEGGAARNYWRGPIVTTVYDMIHEKFPQNFPANDPTRAQKAASVKAADHVVCISQQTKRDLMEILGVNESKISVTYLSHSLACGNADTAPLPAKVNGPFLLFVGPRQGYKNFDALLAAYSSDSALLRDFQLVCLGGGGFSPAELERIRVIPGGEERVIQVSGDDALLAALYSRASAFVYPSRYEGFGIPPLEAMASDCPVVCGHGGSLAEVVGEAASLCDETVPDSLLSAIKAVVYDEGRRKSLIQAGRARVKQFSWERCAMETAAIYRGLK